MLCTGLTHLVATVQDIEPGTAFRLHLQTSMEALHQVSKSYAEVLRQAKSSNEVMYALYQGAARYSQDRTQLATKQVSLEV